MDFPRGEVRVIGHRGAAALAPENSLAAIGAAAAAGAHAVELDVLRAADGSLVLAHGPAVPAGAPALDEALGLAARLGLAVQVDVKDAGLEREVVEALARAGLRERSFVSAHAVEILRAFAAADGGITRALSYPKIATARRSRRISARSSGPRSRFCGPSCRIACRGASARPGRPSRR
jgi:glycerophosphoryl diester phosphodiesterase